MSPREVAFLTTSGTIGGAEMCLLDLLELGAPGWRARAILGSDGPLRAAIEALGIEAAIEPTPSAVAELGDSDRAGGKAALFAKLARAAPAAWSYAGRLGRRLAEARPAIAIAHSIDMKSHWLSAMRAAPRTSGVVWHLHDYLSNRPAMSRLLRMASRRRPGLIAVAVSRSVAEDAESVLGPKIRVRTIENRIDLERFHPPSEPEAPRNGRDPKAPVRVGLMATFARWKGHETFLKAVALSPTDDPSSFAVIGGPIYRSQGSQYSIQELQALADRLGIAGRVEFAGRTSRPEEAMRSLDVLVHASDRAEPFGRTIAEAMATGVAVISTGLGGAGELIDDGESAIRVPPRDPEALADAIGRLVRDEALRSRLGQAGRMRAGLRFDRRRLPSQWTAVYDEAAKA